MAVAVLDLSLDPLHKLAPREAGPHVLAPGLRDDGTGVTIRTVSLRFKVLRVKVVGGLGRFNKI